MSRPPATPGDSLFAGRFRKWPIDVEASQWDGGSTDAARFTEWSDGKVRLVSEMHAPLVLAVYTLHGVTKAEAGDWIIRGPEGDYWPCKPGIFEASYEVIRAS